MGVSPGDPWIQFARQRAIDDRPSGQRDGKDEIESSQNCETLVAVVSQVAFGGDEIPDLLSPPLEGTDGEAWRSELAIEAVEKQM